MYTYNNLFSFNRLADQRVHGYIQVQVTFRTYVQKPVECNTTERNALANSATSC